MDSYDVVVTSRQKEQWFSASVEQVEPIKPPALEEAPSPARLQVQFHYITQHQIFATTPSSTRSIYVLPSPPEETSRPTLIHHLEDAVKTLCGEFDLYILLRTVDPLGANFSPYFSQFEITLGSEEHTRIVSEIKRVGRGMISPEMKKQGLFALQVSILRVYVTYHCMRIVTKQVLEEGEILVWVIGGMRRVRVSGDEICSVCLEEFRINTCIVMPCSYVFHTKCIRTWLAGNKRSCPLCRSKMRTLNGSSLTYIYNLDLKIPA